jgi:hypothetical protein
MLFLPNETEHRGSQGVDNIVDAFCFPLSTIYAALEKTFVDLLVLNAHGLELDIINTINWETVNFGVSFREAMMESNKLTLATPQTIIVSTKYLKDQKETVQNLMSNLGYVEFDQRQDDEYLANNNLIFVRPKMNKAN